MEKNNLKVHFWVLSIAFIILVLTRFLFNKIPLEYGYGQVTLGTFLFLIYGFYLVFVSFLYFNKVFNVWRNNFPWKKELFKAYLILALFSLLISLLFMSANDGVIDIISDVLKPIDFLFDNLPNILFIVGMSIIFPVSLYTLFLSIKSLILVKKENKSYWFGIILLLLSVALGIASFFSFAIVFGFWLAGGIRF